MSSPTKTAAPTAKTPAIDAQDVHQQASDLYVAAVAWLQQHWLQILIAIGIGALIAAALFFVRSLGHRLCRRDTSGTGWWTVLGRAITRTGTFFIVMLSAKLVAGYANAPAEVAMTINFLFTVAAVFQAAVWAREVILGAIEHKTASENYHGEALGSALGIIRLLVTFALFAVALIVVLDNLGVNVSGLIAGLGVGGIAIGLAAQGIFADLFAALAIIFDRPFRRGDAITYGASSGTVEAIGLKSTRIRGTNGEERVVGNKKLLDNEIINNTRREYRRVIFTLGLVQTTPVKAMEALPHMMKEIIEDHGAKFVRAGFAAFGAQSYDFDVEFDSHSAAFQDMYDARHSIGIAIIKRMNDENIALAYPTQTSISAEEAGMIQPKPRRRSGSDTVPAPPSSGDRTASDQEASG